jgi:hypothetical protein
MVPVLIIIIIIMADIITINRPVFQIDSEGWDAYWVGIPAFSLSTGLLLQQ